MTNFKALLVISALLSAGVAQAASHAGAPMAKDAMNYGSGAPPQLAVASTCSNAP